MKHYVRALSCGAAVLAAMAMTLLACGGRQTMASKSAAAYDEAKKKGVPITAGEHGGHTNEAAAETTVTNRDAAPKPMAGMDHSSMAGMDHPASAASSHDMTAMDHSAMPGMKHGASAATTHDMAAMDHSKMQGSKHAAGASGGDMAGMNHSTMPGMAPATPGAHAAMGGGSMAGMPGMQHAAAGPPLVIRPPVTNAAIAQTQPAVTLRADEIDAPAASAIEESAKAASGMSHSMDATPHPQPKPAQPPPAGHQHHGNGEAS